MWRRSGIWFPEASILCDDWRSIHGDSCTHGLKKYPGSVSCIGIHSLVRKEITAQLCSQLRTKPRGKVFLVPEVIGASRFYLGVDNSSHVPFVKGRPIGIKIATVRTSVWIPLFVGSEIQHLVLNWPSSEVKRISRPSSSPSEEIIRGDFNNIFKM